jgi:hypothetical protein
MTTANAVEGFIHFAFDERAQLIRATAHGIITAGEVIEYLRAKAGDDLQGFDELFDARDVVLDLSLDDLQNVADEVNRRGAGLAPGKTAVVTDSAFVYGLASAYAQMVDNGSRFRVFAELSQAKEWLTSSAD